MPDSPGSPVTTLIFKTADEAATGRLAEDVAAVLQAGDLITLSGDLGAGKTTFARAMIRSASGEAELEVPSPTFPIRIDYPLARLPIAHVDLYRVGGDGDALELGLDEALDEVVLIVEWPERISWPDVANRLDVAFGMLDGERTIALAAGGSWPARLQRSRDIRTFLDRSGFAGAKRLHVVGDASAKSFERLVSGAADTAIMMNAPARTPGPPVWNGRPYDDVAHRAMDVLPFLAIGSALAAEGFHVPKVIAQDRAAGLVVMEDLGSDPITGPDGEPIEERYQAAMDLLAHLHRKTWPHELACDGEAYHVPPYDTDALLIEIALYSDWYLPHSRGKPLLDSERDAFLSAWKAVLSRLGGSPVTWVMRDFHSPNILWQPGASGLARVGIIDVQDTLVGHPAYDVASLAQDARADISVELEAALYRRYCAARRNWDPRFDSAGFAQAYVILGAQRATKVLGAFTRLAFHDGKPGYEKYLPRVREVLARNLADPVLSALRVWYKDLV